MYCGKGADRATKEGKASGRCDRRSLRERVGQCGRKRAAVSHSLEEGGNLHGAGLGDSAESPVRKEEHTQQDTAEQPQHLWHHHKRVSLTLTLLLSYSDSDTHAVHSTRHVALESLTTLS